ncbi:HU family DNA-binding protein [Frigoriflavimonas asaccharolytica]|uniref:DNA-binding protein HU-beta n=1 Tax=Frigoriflavimonas asaccharolytica TaxID=2735899 RepID=A0A8J8G5C1_9FLAO|nr:HU family DNA-binding protein [Frigoriflavimonas asaccharolytica]NRS91738.1 DNA-binding protein HU-beta [Frigoriflavimonas asaccharolytica]
MTKAELVNTISDKLGTEKGETQKVVEAFMHEIRSSLYQGDNVYLRGFGSFIVKTRAAKTGRNISKNIAIEIPAHNIPAFKPAKSFVEKVKTKITV